MKPDHENTPCGTEASDTPEQQSDMKLKLRMIEERFGSEAALAALDYADLLISLHNRELAHQLRTALTSLVGASARLSAEENVDDTLRSNVSEAELAVKSLRGVARNVEAFSTPLHLDIKPSPITSLIKQAYELASEAVFEKSNINSLLDFRFNGCEDAAIRISQSHMVRAMANIIQSVIGSNNDGKSHLEESRIVFVQVDVDPRMVNINMSLQGVIITEQVQKNAGPDATGWLENGDADFGLLVAKRIVEVHGGEMEVFVNSGNVESTRVKLHRHTSDSKVL